MKPEVALLSPHVKLMWSHKAASDVWGAAVLIYLSCHADDKLLEITPCLQVKREDSAESGSETDEQRLPINPTWNPRRHRRHQLEQTHFQENAAAGSKKSKQ